MMLSSSIEKMMGKNLTSLPVCLIRNYSLRKVFRKANISHGGNMCFDHPFSTYVKFFDKLIFVTLSTPLTTTHTCAYLGVRNTVYRKILRTY